MTPKQRKFVDEYLIDQNRVAAYKRAGFRGLGKSASNGASRLMANDGVRAAIEAGLQRQKAEMEQANANATAPAYDALPLEVRQLALRLNDGAVLGELAAIAFSDPAEMVDSPILRKMPARARHAIASLKIRRYTEGKGEDAKTVEEVEIRCWDKNAALSNLMKSLGMMKSAGILTYKSPIERLLADFHAFNPEMETQLRQLLIEGNRARKAAVDRKEPDDNSSESTE